MPSLSQDIVPGFASIDYTILPPSHFEKLLLYLQQQKNEFWGVSAIFENNGKIKSFGLATLKKVYVINDVEGLAKKHLDQLWSVCGDSALPVGFNMDTISMSFYRTFNTRFSAADLGVVYGVKREESHPITVIQKLYPTSNNSARLKSMWTQQGAHQEINMCLRAWISLR